jgi:hypothetical protein
MMSMFTHPLLNAMLVLALASGAAPQAGPASKNLTDARYRISFDYPEDYKLIKSAAAVENGSLEGIFNTPDEWLVATLEMPGGQYDGTDFKQALFTVTVEPKTAAAPCLDWPKVHDDLTGRDARVDAIPFRRVEDGSAGAGTQVWDILYYGYANRVCYGIRLRLMTGGLHAAEGIKAVDQKAVMERMGRILASVKLRPR